MVLIFLRCQNLSYGILNKVVEFKGFLADQGAVYTGISESQTYKSTRAFSDGRGSLKTVGLQLEGLGPLWTQCGHMQAWCARASSRFGTESKWRTAQNRWWLGLGTSQAKYAQGHLEANKELSAGLAFFREKGYRIVFGGGHERAYGRERRCHPNGRSRLNVA